MPAVREPCTSQQQMSCALLEENLEARGGIEPPVKVLQTFALPLGHRAGKLKSVIVVSFQQRITQHLLLTFLTEAAKAGESGLRRPVSCSALQIR
jgi:hypothetical protein